MKQDERATGRGIRASTEVQSASFPLPEMGPWSLASFLPRMKTLTSLLPHPVPTPELLGVPFSFKLSEGGHGEGPGQAREPGCIKMPGEGPWPPLQAGSTMVYLVVCLEVTLGQGRVSLLAQQIYWITYSSEFERCFRLACLPSVEAAVLWEEKKDGSTSSDLFPSLGTADEINNWWGDI